MVRKKITASAKKEVKGAIDGIRSAVGGAFATISPRKIRAAIPAKYQYLSEDQIKRQIKNNSVTKSTPPAAPDGSSSNSPSVGGNPAMIPAAAATAATTSTGPQPPKKKRITAAAVKELKAYFDKHKFPKNTEWQDLHMNSASHPTPELDEIVAKYSLKGGQVKTQLKNWLAITYDFAGKVYDLGPNEIRIMLKQRLPPDADKFAIDVITAMIPGSSEDIPDDKNRQFRLWYCTNNQNGKHLLTMILDDESLCALFAALVQAYLDIAAETFPNTAKGRSKAKLDFIRQREARRVALCAQFIEHIDQLPAFQDLLDKQEETINYGLIVNCKSLFCSIEIVCFRLWCLYNYAENAPPVLLPAGGHHLVHEYSKSILYYVAGFILAGMAKENKLIVTMGGFMSCIAENHSLSAEEALRNELPTEVVDRRERKYLRRASKPFFDFICHLEVIFMHNMTVEMLMAYAAGDLLGKINDAIIANDEIRNTFRQLVSEEAQSKFDLFVEACKDRKINSSRCSMFDVLSYILKKFKHVRGRWFSKGILGQTHKGSSAAENQTTRNKVLINKPKANAANLKDSSHTTMDPDLNMERGQSKSYILLESSSSDDESNSPMDIVASKPVATKKNNYALLLESSSSDESDSLMEIITNKALPMETKEGMVKCMSIASGGSLDDDEEEDNHMDSSFTSEAREGQMYCSVLEHIDIWDAEEAEEEMISMDDDSDDDGLDEEW